MSDYKNVIVQGRIVWTCGETPFKGSQRKDALGKPVLNDKGEPSMQYGFGLAVPKPTATSTPEAQKNFMDLWNAMQEEAKILYPTGNIPPGFSFKFKDGDGIDHNGNPFNTRDGYAGCYVFALTTSLPVKFFKYEGAYIQVSDGIKCGDYVQVQVGVKAHAPRPGTQGKPGLYLNPGLTLLIGYGKEITGGSVDAASVFGATPPPTPQGASATPISSAPSFGSFAQAQATPATPAAPVNTWNGQPNVGVLPPQFQAPAAVPAPPVIPPPNFNF